MVEDEDENEDEDEDEDEDEYENVEDDDENEEEEQEQEYTPTQPPRCVVVVPTCGCLPTEASLVAVRGGEPLTLLCYVDTATTVFSPRYITFSPQPPYPKDPRIVPYLLATLK